MRGATKSVFVEKIENNAVADQISATVEDIGTVDEGDQEYNEKTGLSKEQAFDILRNSRRRAVITCLRAHGGTLSVKELSERVAAEEYDVSASELSSEQYKRVYTGLYQCHLERMDELGVLEFDTNDNTVRLLEAASHLRPNLDEERRLDPARVQFGVAATVAVIVAFGIAPIGPFSSVPSTWIGALTIVALLGLALFQLFERGVRR